ncbi:MAG TPA: hypothetical protein ENL03_03245, partial [Phycisphaerae bacterium]|nr:hypothetical protein [Phycisphaerae bacterium]
MVDSDASITNMQSQMTDMLGSCRRRIRISAAKQALATGFRFCLPWCISIAVLHLLVRLMCRLVGVSLPVDPYWFSFLVVGAWVAVMVGFVIAAWLVMPSVAVAAERLDLASADHNRIATALNLLGDRERSSFASAAILDGIEYLRKLQDAIPRLYVISQL